MLAKIEGVVIGVRTYQSERDGQVHNILRLLVDEEVCEVDAAVLPSLLKFDWVAARGDLRTFERRWTMRGAEVSLADPDEAGRPQGGALVAAARRAQGASEDQGE